MTNLELLDDLIGLNDTCLRSGMVKVQRYESCTQILVPHGNNELRKDTYKHYFKIIPVSIRKVCWTTPYRCKKNIDILTKIKNEYLNYFYLVIEPYWFGKKIRIKCYDVFGRKKKTFKLRMFSINIGKETVSIPKVTKKNSKGGK